MGDRSAGYDCKTYIHVLPSKGNLTSLHTAARFSHTRTRLPRTLLWTNFHCQQRFLARRLLCQHLWGQLKLTSSKEAPVMCIHPLSFFQACPTGYRVTGNGSSECLPCSDPAILSDYFFLGFVCLVCVGVRLAVVAVSTIGKPGWAPKTYVIDMLILTLTTFKHTCSVELPHSRLLG